MNDVHQQDTVVILHGIFRSSRHMRKLASYLQSHYDVLNLDYPSTQYPLETLASIIQEKVEKTINPDKPTHFVGYSMGGLLLRILLRSFRPKQLGRVVQLATPNHGSEVANFLKNFWLYQKLYGPAGQQLITDQSQIQHLFGSVDYELGILAGDFSLDPLSSLLIPGANDGKVSVSSSKLPGMQDHCIIKASHTFFPSNQHVLQQTATFLQQGKFV